MKRTKRYITPLNIILCIFIAIIVILHPVYQGSLLAGLHVGAEPRGSTYIIIRNANYGYGPRYVAIHRDNTLFLISKTRDSSPVREITESKEYSADIKSMRNWCVSPPPAAPFFDTAAYIVSVRCTPADYKVFIVSPDHIPEFIRGILPATQTQ